MTPRIMNIVGQLLWMLGCGAFLVSASKANDPWAASGAALFAAGIVLFLVPLARTPQ